MKKIISFGCIFVLTAVFLSAQIMTAGDFFQSINEFYGTIKDFEANVTITDSKSVSSAKVSFKRPNLLRFDFSNPDTQVICFNAETLTIYVPRTRAIMTQTVSGSGRSSGAGIATPEGLSLMRRYYSISYETGQNAEPLEEGSSEKVVKLILVPKTSSEGYRRIRLSINPETKLIRRVEGYAKSGETFIFDFKNYVLNKGIPDTRFIYDPPSSANNYDNFLYAE